MPLKKAILWILASTLIVSGTPAMGFLYYYYVKAKRASDDQYQIVAIVQTSSQNESLKTAYLAELLDLSLDKPTNLFRLNSHEARRQLLLSPLIKDARVKKISPGTLYIDYNLRKPIALLGDFTNTAIDEDGVIFPIHPFFTPKKLPLLILGISEENLPPWGTPLETRRTDLGIELLNLVTSQCCTSKHVLTQLDVSKAFAPSYGQREIILVFENKLEKESKGTSVLIQYSHLVRISTENYLEELANYLTLAEYLQTEELKVATTDSAPLVKYEPIIINMRIPHLAFIKR
jgi:hypothetical protein